MRKPTCPPCVNQFGHPLWDSRRQFQDWADQHSGPTPEFCDGCDAVVKSGECEYCGTRRERRKVGLLKKIKDFLLMTNIEDWPFGPF